MKFDWHYSVKQWLTLNQGIKLPFLEFLHIYPRSLSLVITHDWYYIFRAFSRNKEIINLDVETFFNIIWILIENLKESNYCTQMLTALLNTTRSAIKVWNLTIRLWCIYRL